MTDQSTNNGNGFWKGKTEATLEGIAKKLDQLEDRILNCPIGIEHDSQIKRIQTIMWILMLVILATHPQAIGWIIDKL